MSETFSASSGSPGDRALATAFERVIDLQPAYKAANTPEMQERGLLIREQIPGILRPWLPEFEPITGPLATEGRDGTGLKNRVPWARLFSPAKAASAMEGWYLVYLFAAHRPTMYLALITGTTRWANTQYVPKPTTRIKSMVTEARAAIGKAGLIPADSLTSIELGDPGELGKSYEAGTVYAYRYDRTSLPDDQALKEDVRRMLPALAELYRSEPTQGGDPAPLPSEFEVEFDRLARAVQAGPPNDASKWNHLEAHLNSGLGLGPSSSLGAKAANASKEVGNRFGEALDQARDPLFMFISKDSRATALAKARSHTRPGRFSLVALCGRATDDGPITVLDVVFSGLGVQLAKRLAALFPTAKIPVPGEWTLKWDPATIARVKGDLLLDDEIVVESLVALASGRHLLLTGPPGTAKSTLADRLASVAAEAGVTSGHVVATATADWTSFDTIGGYFPTGAGMELDFREGVVTRSIGSDNWCVIDEINRAHVDRAIGPLISLLGGATEVAVELPQRNKKGRPITMALDPTSVRSSRTEDGDYTIGTNWRLIATMNSFDKNALFPLTAAFTRRFANVVVGIPSNPGDVLDAFGVPPDSVAWKLFTVVMTEVAPDKWVNPRPLGPAIVRDGWNYVSRISGGEPPAERSVLQALALFALPQYVGLDDLKFAQLRDHLAGLVESPAEFGAELDRVFRGLQGR